MLLRHALGEIVRRRRQALGLTLRDVARDGRISLPYLSEVERGRKEASSEIIQAICGVLRLDLAELLLDAAVLVNQPVATGRPVVSLTPRATVDRDTETDSLTEVGKVGSAGGTATVSAFDSSAFLLAA